ncbi:MULTISPECIES: FtsK/SpoIIIE domain-containing protein [Streptomyces]|uniref:Conjugal transfer protein TraS n=1 Tax=Streptomyces tsukubensis (strain DSM 42081 / NBRC 108919 / NRRL 18488 / 9993) TaxID=1114943 RepID=I2N1R8_STRT9|nr:MULTISPECIES: FtsK/SpoIIIE domain-containing protein [Streptomyces]AZK95124.1 conjugal transfer protein TraS [Streptomyces tsukubensis]EIF90965.1 plasmid transfer protein [Streptomyces tsukubensis NRRL18488]MYS64198.1 conjugal transfer protein TraS [Streptomyces sp. SID5473]QKM68811.1 conjugal transfer protein TraS [Streptomyces tsukubensis NRRL18488]TAI43615.1 conjugal transfer protein TraS [Streptomyces tsukubensis]
MTADATTLLSVGGPLAVLGAGAAYTRARHPGLYWTGVGLPIATARLLATYASVMEACGLTVPPSRLRVLALKATTRREIRPVPPRRGLPRPTSTGLRLRLRLAPGQEPADVAASAERLRHAWGVHGVYVTVLKPGVVELRVVGFDVLRHVRMPRVPEPGLLRVPVALREDATPYIRDYCAVPHGLTLGATLAGKSMFLRHLVAGLAPQPVALVGIDCKRGVELAPFTPRLSALATDPAEASGLLSVLMKEMEDRYDLIRARQGIAPGTPDEEITSDVWGLPEPERPVPLVLLVDEVAELFLVASRKDEERRDEMVTQLIRLAQLGRAAGIYLEVCGQRFGAELGKGATMLRAQLTGRVCHRVNDEASAKMALGDIAPEAVMAACAIPPELPGLAVAGDTSGGWSRIRTPYLSLTDAAATCRNTAHLTPELPALKRFRPAGA